MTIKYPNDFFGHPQANTLSDINITREDIIDAIKTISQNFWRPWWISIQYYQWISSKSLLQLLNKASLNTGEIPIDLKRAIITLIYKGGFSNLPKNYRPVARTSQFLKLLEKILAKIIHQFLETHQKINPSNMASSLADPAYPSNWSITTRYKRN